MIVETGGLQPADRNGMGMPQSHLRLVRAENDYDELMGIYQELKHKNPQGVINMTWDSLDRILDNRRRVESELAIEPLVVYHSMLHWFGHSGSMQTVAEFRRFLRAEAEFSYGAVIDDVQGLINALGKRSKIKTARDKYEAYVKKYAEDNDLVRVMDEYYDYFWQVTWEDVERMQEKLTKRSIFYSQAGKLLLIEKGSRNAFEPIMDELMKRFCISSGLRKAAPQDLPVLQERAVQSLNCQLQNVWKEVPPVLAAYMRVIAKPLSSVEELQEREEELKKIRNETIYVKFEEGRKKN